MTWLDTYLQNQRISKALSHIDDNISLLDIGCHKGELLLKAENKINRGVGIDPACNSEFITDKIELIQGVFPTACNKQYQFDCITALAVLEHIPSDEQAAFFNSCYALLHSNGKLIITVPDARVDDILQLLKRLKLVTGIKLEQHYKFNSNSTPQLAAASGFKMLLHKHFQLRLNNLFVFVKL